MSFGHFSLAPACPRVAVAGGVVPSMRDRELDRRRTPEACRVARARDALGLLGYALDGRPAPVQAASTPSRLSPPFARALGAVARALRELDDAREASAGG